MTHLTMPLTPMVVSHLLSGQLHFLSAFFVMSHSNTASTLTCQLTLTLDTHLIS